MYPQNSINNFTIIIPTFNRPNYLKRILEFYQNDNINIKIFDSSINRFDSEMLLKSNIEYIHLPNMKPLDKVLYALKSTKTQYMVFCADDDFIFVDAIIKCCNFLDKNSDYVCAQGKLVSFRYTNQDDGLKYIIETYFTTHKSNSHSDNIKDRFSSFSQPYRHTFYGVHKVDNILRIYQLIKQYELTEPFLLELVQSALLILSGKVMTFGAHLYHLRETVKTVAASRIYKDIPTLVNMNHPEVAVVKHIIVEQLKQKYDISHNTCIDISEAFFEDFCDFVQQKKSMSQKFHTISLDKNTINPNDKQTLNELYKLEPDLKLAEELILKHKIFSGFLYQENSDLKSFSKNLLEINQIIEKLKLEISNSDKIVIYGAGSFASLLIEVFNAQIEFIVDKNEDLVGKKLKDKDIKPIHMLSSQEVDYDVILVSVLGRNHEIRDYINQLNLKKVILFCQMELAY